MGLRVFMNERRWVQHEGLFKSASRADAPKTEKSGQFAKPSRVVYPDFCTDRSRGADGVSVIRGRKVFTVVSLFVCLLFFKRGVNGWIYCRPFLHAVTPPTSKEKMMYESRMLYYSSFF